MLIAERIIIFVVNIITLPFPEIFEKAVELLVYSWELVCETAKYIHMPVSLHTTHLEAPGGQTSSKSSPVQPEPTRYSVAHVMARRVTGHRSCGEEAMN